jgi:hypothetical protein
LGNLVIEQRDLLIQEIQVGQMPRQQKAMVLPHKAGERLFQGNPFLAQASLGQLGEQRRVGLAGHEGGQHRSRGDSGQI